MEGTSLKLEVMQKVPEVVVHKRTSQGKGVKGREEKKNVPGWSMEVMKEKPNIAVVEDTEEMRKWRGLSQSDCWKNLAERMEEEVLDKYKVEDNKREAFRGGGASPPGTEEGAQKHKIQQKKWREDCWARVFSLCREFNLQRLQSKQDESTEEEEMKQQQRMMIMKDLIKNIRYVR